MMLWLDNWLNLGWLLVVAFSTLVAGAGMGLLFGVVALVRLLVRARKKNR